LNNEEDIEEEEEEKEFYLGNVKKQNENK